MTLSPRNQSIKMHFLLYNTFQQLLSSSASLFASINNLKISLCGRLCGSIILFGEKLHRKDCMQPSYTVDHLIQTDVGYVPAYLNNQVKNWDLSLQL